jgi:hypothetical protein
MDYLQFIFHAISNLLTQNLASSTQWGKTFFAPSPQSSSFGSELNRLSHLLAAFLGSVGDY